MKLLIAVDKTREIYLKPFAEKLQKLGIECTIINDLDIYDSKLNHKIFRWLKTPEKIKEIIKDVNPDIIFTERVSHFCYLISREKIPYIIFLRGNIWEEVKIQSNQEKIFEKIEIKIKMKIADLCFKKSNAILPICNHLEKIVKQHYPQKPTKVLHQGIDIENWKKNEKENTFKLKHPCVGFLQGAVVWGKAKEMLILPKIIESLPNVNFYWAGNGKYRGEILSKLKKFENFHWLGSLEYPENVKTYLNEIDVYCLCTGLDMSPHTILEAAIMKKPIIATNVGGISELIEDGKTGYLVERGDVEQWINKIQLVLDKKTAEKLGENAHKFVKENFSWDKIAKDFLNITKSYL